MKKIKWCLGNRDEDQESLEFDIDQLEIPVARQLEKYVNIKL